MTKPLRATKAELCRAIEAAQSKGLRVLAVNVDGTVIVDRKTEADPHPLAPRIEADNDEWVIQS